MKRVALVLLILGAVVGVVTLWYGGWCVERWINWKFGYSKMVRSCQCP